MLSRNSTLVVLSVLLLLSAGLMLAADEPTAKDQLIAARQKALDAGISGPKGTFHPYFGTADGTTVNIHSYEFQGQNPFGDHVADDGNGFRYFSQAGSGFLAAPVTQIPSGVVIDYLEMSDCVGTGGDMFLGLWDSPYGSGSGAGTNITFVNTVAGCGTDGSYSLGYQVPSNAGHPLWLLMLWGSTYDGSSKFNDVTIGFHRMVSPAPGSPSFGDVPVSDPGFQYIEALVSSGITAGCGGGNYCPDNPLTRRQMAVFLSKAFGLHWPN